MQRLTEAIEAARRIQCSPGNWSAIDAARLLSEGGQQDQARHR